MQNHARLDRSPRLLGSRLHSRLRSPTSTLSQGRGRGFPYTSAPGATRSLPQQQSSHNLVLEPLGEPRRGRGRGVRLRGGGAGRGIVRGEGHGVLEEESEDSSSSSTTSSSSDDEAEEMGKSNGKGLDKENQPDLRRERATKDEEEATMEVRNQNSGEEEEEEDMETQTGGKDGSNYKVTLQKPRARRDPSAIVPKLEAVTAQTATSTLHTQSRALIRPPIRDHVPCSDQHSNRHRPAHSHNQHAIQRSSCPERVESSKKIKPSRTAKLGNVGSSSSASELCHPRVPLSALQEGGSEADRESGGAGPACEREVWVSVFRYLSRADLCVCMAVCKNWYKW